MSYARSNLLTRGMRGDAKTISGISFAWDGDWYHVSGTATGDIGWRSYKSTDIPIVADKKYTLSVEFAGGMPDADSYFSTSFQLFSDFRNNRYKAYGMYRNEHIILNVDQGTLAQYKEGFQLWGPIIKGGATVDLRVRWMLVEGDTPAAWAPAEGETLSGGGASMSANLLAGVEPTIPYNGQYATVSDGVFTSSVRTGVWYNVAQWILPTTQALAENQTVHMGLSAKWHGTAATTGVAYAAVKYADAAGSINNADIPITGITTEWQRFSLSAVVPSGMHIVDFHISAKNLDAAFDATSLVLSYGSPVCLASSAHTPYATQDHLRSEYATKAALKVTSDAVTAEVEERGKLAGKVGTLESTSGTHASRLEQLASSIKSLVKGESTYTDPDGKSATSGIYSLVTQTRDSVTALFGQYTKTADLASTQAVKDAKKAGTDAASAASAAQSTADTAKANAATAQSTADRAQSTADAALDNAGTANGRVRAVEARVSASIDGLDVRVRGVSEAVSAQGATVRDVERNMSFGLDGLVIGAADSASKVRITEKRETFEVDGKTVLALDGDTSTVEASALKIGGYVWTVTNGGKNLTLVYRG